MMWKFNQKVLVEVLRDRTSGAGLGAVCNVHRFPQPDGLLFAHPVLRVDARLSPVRKELEEKGVLPPFAHL